MAHYHHCAVCKIPVAMCSDDSCKTVENHPNAAGHHTGGGDPEKAKLHYCPEHQPDPEFHIEPTPPLSRLKK
jgi:hypothetical protein